MKEYGVYRSSDHYMVHLSSYTPTKYVTLEQGQYMAWALIILAMIVAWQGFRIGRLERKMGEAPKP